MVFLANLSNNKSSDTSSIGLFSNLQAPVWLVNRVYQIIYPTHARLGDLYSAFDDLSGEMMAVSDVHVANLLQWIMDGRWAGILRIRWTIDQRTGHYEWEDAMTIANPETDSHYSSSSEYDPETTPTSSSDHSIFFLVGRRFRTGALNDIPNDQIHDMLQLGKFNLLTQGVTERTRTQYLSCWKRWDQYCSCLGIPPWLSTAKRGWGDPLIDFLVWEHKIFGLQHSIIAKRFYAIRFLRVAEGYDDLALRGQRIKFITK